jgi:hypothetical protein
MNNLTTLNLEDDFFLTNFESMKSRFTRARIKTLSKGRFKGYQKPKYQVKTFAELRKAITQITKGEMNQDLYSTSNGIYREKMRVAQSVRDRYRVYPTNYFLTANPAQLKEVIRSESWSVRKGRYASNYSA